ncbi:MAG: ABC transporter ATP-binding protein [Clostridia bacterium]|nr:ABC transporter ATP-binding protein [Clostridia bacterium]
MIKLLKYLKKYIFQAISAPALKVLEVCFELIVPLVVASIIDVGIKNSNTSYVLKMCGILAVLAVVGLGCTLIAQFFAAKTAVGFCADIRAALFKHISSLSYSSLDNLGASTLITRLTSDLNQVQTGVNLTLRLLLRSPFVVFGAMIMAFIVDSKAALVFVITIPLLAVIIFAVMLVSIPLYRSVQAALDKVVLKTGENLQGVRVIRAFCKENDEIAEFEEKNKLLNAMQIRVGKIAALLNPATIIIINIAISILIYKGALRVNIGELSAGEVVALYNYMSQILIELIKLANLIINVTKSVASGNRIQSVFEIEPEQNRGKIKTVDFSKPAVEFKNVSFSYNGEGENAIENINLKIGSGENVGIIGPTGSGKSTIVNLIPGFYNITSGEIKIFGENIENLDLDFLRSIIGIVPQKAVLFKGSIRDNMKISAPNISDEEIYTALKMAQAYEIVKGKEGELDFIIEQDGRNLSGGQKQRLCIARALVRKPKILILDDSSSALDFATDAALRKALSEISADTTVITISQRASAIRNCDNIFVLDEGVLLASGKDNELKDSCELYLEIRKTQFGEEGA